MMENPAPFLLLGAAVILAILARSLAPWMAAYPADWVAPLSHWTGAAMAAFVDAAKPFFRIVSLILTWPLDLLQRLLAWVPAPVFILLSALAAWQAAGWRSVLLTLVTLLYIWIAGYWAQSMNTLSLVSIAILLAVVIGFVCGVWAYRNLAVRSILDPVLDLMQTIPTFAYLIPILLLFGFGPVVGLIASAVFAAPPMVRNTLLGLQRVPSEIREAGLICGCAPGQQFWWVDVPSAMPQLKLGINQTTMAGFAMIIISAIIGGFNDIGWEVLSNIRRANFGDSILSGLVIALLAMSLDRITLGLAGQNGAAPVHRLNRRNFLLAAIGAVMLGVICSLIMTRLSITPQGRLMGLSDSINAGLAYVTSTYAVFLNGLKASLLYFAILPVKIGLERVVTPFSWGFALTPPVIAAYWTLVTAAALAAARYRSMMVGTAIFVIGCFLYVGTTGMPWPAVVILVTACAYRCGGWPVAIFALVSQVFILLAGQWQQAMISVYLCASAVALSIAIGVALGIWGAASDRASAVLRQVNDALQTIPQFVFLIPVLMFFGVGDFTGLLAIMLYAVVPSIRYTEHGLRQVPAAQVEAATAMGCTKSQILWQVKLPNAFPEILLGINQTILFAMGMLVIASLVGTDGLGQQIYIGLGKNDPGMGVIAGLSLALIGMIADRILRAAAASRKAALGIV